MIPELYLETQHVAKQDDDKSYRLGEEPAQNLEDTIFDDYPLGNCTLKELLLDIFKFSRKEFGGCTSKVYIGKGGDTDAIGWTFERRRPFEDDNKSFYTHEVWVTIAQKINGVMQPFFFNRKYAEVDPDYIRFSIIGR